ncbi:MAG: hypothetical protein GPOALKHO_001582 [Sodalis sp.]|nr:MAG: hypothetical protein GPOALKHO_001582 [Sodalis sp.]
MEVSLHPWFGLGFKHELGFINYDSTHINTAHSVYLGALYRGAVGLALLASSEYRLDTVLYFLCCCLSLCRACL